MKYLRVKSFLHHLLILAIFTPPSLSKETIESNYDFITAAFSEKFDSIVSTAKE